MKIRTKLLTAVLATATALSCALTASALTTTLNLQGNESTPATLKKAEGAEEATAEATLTLKSSDFENVKGAKIKVTLGENITFADENVTITDANNTWVKNSNFAVSADNKTITLVDVFNMAGATAVNDLELTFKFNVKATAMGSYDVTVSGDFADDAADKVYPVTAYANLVIGREETTATNLEALNKSIENANDYFIPYGGAYKGDINLSKDENGKFSLADGVTPDDKIDLLKCKLPEAGKVTTFGASNSLVENKETAIQFGSYINEINQTNGTFGTLIIVSRNLPATLTSNSYKQGTYENAVKCFNGDVEKLLNNIIAKFKSEWFDGKLHPYTYGTTKEVVYAAVVPQTKYMWRNSDENYTKLQYAVSCTGLDDVTKKAYVYTAVGYSLKDNKYAFSTEVQSASFDSLNATN